VLLVAIRRIDMSGFESNYTRPAGDNKRYLPPTKDLHLLRKLVIESKEDDAEQLIRLSELRTKVATVLQNTSSLATAEIFFYQAWDVFSEFAPDHPFYLPPLYKSEYLHSILKAGIKCLLLREVGRIDGCDNNVGHLVLGGVEGAGKTTLMRALGLGTSALLQHMIPISHDYLIFKTPQDIIWDALKIYFSVEKDSQFDPLDELKSRHHDALLLLDEFQNNFRLADDASLEDGKHATSTFHQYSRLYGTLGVIGGSSVDMHLLMFKSGRDETTDYWRRLGYPDFNGTLYKLRTVPALRSVKELKDYITVRYPLWALTDEDISLLLTHTGGIGRWVHIVSEACCYNQDLALEGGWYQFCTEECLQECTNENKIYHEKVLEDRENRELISYMLMTAQPEKDLHGRVVGCGGVEKALLLLALQTVGISSPIDLVKNAEARSVIYITGNSQVQFARPVDAAIYSRDMPPVVHRLLLLSAVHLMVCGIGNDNGGVTDVNAGNALEDLVREGVYKGAGINDYAEFSSDATLTIANDKLCLIKSGNNAVPVTVALMESINLKHVSWRKEHGLDGVCFEKDTTSDNSWHLDMWQCKGGRWDVEIGGGNKSMSTALQNFEKKHQLQDVGDKQITEIVLKAEVGICLLVKALRAAIPGVIVKPRKLIITTTKKCSSSCLETAEFWRNAGGVMIESGVLKHFSMNSLSEYDTAVKSRFEVRITSGCGWVVGAIPDSTLRAAAQQLLVTPQKNNTWSPNDLSPPAAQGNLALKHTQTEILMASAAADAKTKILEGLQVEVNLLNSMGLPPNELQEEMALVMKKIRDLRNSDNVSSIAIPPKYVFMPPPSTGASSFTGTSSSSNQQATPLTTLPQDLLEHEEDEDEYTHGSASSNKD